jgi:endonuclease/exonuclease/phosphatase family metal-dependent hydrolase
LHTCFVTGQNNIAICTWNIQDLGQSKNETEIDFIANTVKGYDILAIVEVVAGDGGAQAVARLADALNRKGSKWDYSISNPTTGEPHSKERYAFIWKTSKVKKVGDAWLEQHYQAEINREPYFADFSAGGKVFTFAAFHAIPKSKQPETEIKYFKFFPEKYPGKNLIFAGDFNCPQTHSVFNPLKTMGYKPVLTGQKTSLRQECINTDCLASEYDNIFYNSAKIKFVKAGVVHFYKSFPTMKEAGAISDHIPVWFEFSLN